MYLLGYSLNKPSPHGANHFDRLRRRDAIVMIETSA